MRAFIAIEVGETARSPASGVGSNAPSHLTLRFLAEVAAGREGPIAAALRDAVVDLSPFELTLSGVGAFPSREEPRVVWVGVTTGGERVAELAGRISAALSVVGFPPDPVPLTPHVTLFRVRSRLGRDRARRVLRGIDPPPPARAVGVREIVLKESVLTPGGPVHRTLDAFPLSGPARAAD